MAAVAVAVGAAAWRRWRPFPAAVAGRSMLPTLPPGALLLVTERGSVRPGAVVVLRHGGRELVKRVVRVTPAGVDVEGDNPAASTDSRSFGPLPLAAVAGVVRAVYWPPTAWRVLPPPRRRSAGAG